ncbi:uncharacterized protein LOC125500204 [Athalia rosae]|uniref:uncharacterized protein LOC125500204 n=1 Tax=Athalia rosae TaxID=37344 RepID=UPI0020342396|nr:uncharacterized protein LOC125500204 [Athalia rosae]
MAEDEQMNEEMFNDEWPEDQLLGPTEDPIPAQEQAQPAAPNKEEAAEPRSSANVAPAAEAAVEKVNSKGTRGGQGGRWSQSRQQEALATRMILNYVRLSHPNKRGRGNDHRKEQLTSSTNSQAQRYRKIQQLTFRCYKSKVPNPT